MPVAQAADVYDLGAGGSAELLFSTFEELYLGPRIGLWSIQGSTQTSAYSAEASALVIPVQALAEYRWAFGPVGVHAGVALGLTYATGSTVVDGPFGWRRETSDDRARPSVALELGASYALVPDVAITAAVEYQHVFLDGDDAFKFVLLDIGARFSL